MRIFKILVAFAITTLIVGCVPSLHPLFTEKDLVFEPALVGAWVGEEGKNVWTFQKMGDKVYELSYTQEGEPGKFEAHLVRLGKYLFLDIYPQEPEINANDFYKIHLIPAHTFLRVWIEGDILRLAMLDSDWLEKMVAQKKIDIAHEALGDSVVLTASTKALQEFMLKYAEDSKVFPEPGVLHRLPAKEAERISLQTPDAITSAEMSEDLEIMSRIIDKALREKFTGEYYSSLLLGGKGCRGVYLRNYGVLFTVNVQFPVAEIQFNQSQADEAEQGLWEQTELLVRNKAVVKQAQTGNTRSMPTQRAEMSATAGHYGPEKVNQLKEQLIRLIADYAANIAQLKAHDVISFIVFGKGASDIVTQSNLLLPNQLAVTAVTTTTLIVKVKKSDLDAHKAGKMDFKDFLKRAEVVQY